MTVLLLADFYLPINNLAAAVSGLAKNRNRVIAVGQYGNESLELLASALAQALKRKFVNVVKAKKLPEYGIPHLYFAASASLLSDMRPGDIAVVENLEKLSRYEINKTAKLAGHFVNDDFSADESFAKMLAHDLPKSEGQEFAKAKNNLRSFAGRIKPPLVLVLGGKKLSTKARALERLMPRADSVLTGGGAANLFLKTAGFAIGDSEYDSDADIKIVKKLLRDNRAKIKMPLDVVVTGGSSKHPECVKSSAVKSHQRILDIGPATVLSYSKLIKHAKTLVWCGSLGRVEEKSFSHGTAALLRLAASRPHAARLAAVAGGRAILPWLQSEGQIANLDLVMPSTVKLLHSIASA